jgi:RHS repeat-associated protein
VQDDQVYHYHLDHLGTPRELTNEQGKIVWKAKYKTYGNLALKEVEEVENNLRFQGQYFDEETGLHYNRFRYYSPDTGQFINQDPIGLLGGLNNYQYAPNPVQWIDPLGLCSEGVKAPPTYDELKDLAQNKLDFSTKKDGAVFWSSSANSSNIKIAQNWASDHGKTTLEQTKGGIYLDNLDLFNPANGLTGNQAKEVWDIASRKFAQGATGEAYVFSTGATKIGKHGEKTWWKTEKPTLMENDDITRITRMKKDGSIAKNGHIDK